MCKTVRMNPPSMESIFLILSGVIVLAGVLYWFWSHLQLTQKKVQLLESAVFELRGMLSVHPGSTIVSGSAVVPVPVSVSDVDSEEKVVYTDLEDDDWETPATANSSIPSESENTVTIAREDYTDDLQPGGRLLVPSEEEFKEAETVQEGEFKELFVQKESPVAAAPAPASASASESLESMPLKELRRLGEKRGVAGANEMRKKELLAALRNGVTGQQHTVTIEKALELNIDLEGDAVETVEAEILE